MAFDLTQSVMRYRNQERESSPADRLLYSTFEKGSSLAPYLNAAKSAALKYLDTNHPSTISIRLEIKVLKIKGIAK
ncbi:MAG: hypothetical protein IPJ13_05015 [Saprospiraceae bacterium]|nr:hypothetical protein [Saprospiraceae bacterium]